VFFIVCVLYVYVSICCVFTFLWAYVWNKRISLFQSFNIKINAPRCTCLRVSMMRTTMFCDSNIITSVRETRCLWSLPPLEIWQRQPWLVESSWCLCTTPQPVLCPHLAVALGSAHAGTVTARRRSRRISAVILSPPAASVTGGHSPYSPANLFARDKSLHKA